MSKLIAALIAATFSLGAFAQTATPATPAPATVARKAHPITLLRIAYGL